MSLTGKRILIGISGGIAAYKSAELVRRLKERHAHQKGGQIQAVDVNGKKQDGHYRLVQHDRVELMVDTQILTICNPSCDPLELKAGQE